MTKHRFVEVLLGLVLALGMLASAIHPVAAQTNRLTVTITTPLEDETFYAGAYSLVYSIDIAGSVVTSNPEPTLVRVRLDILRGTEIVNTLTTRLRDDGAFAFAVTVNPDSPAGQYMPDQRNCDTGHYVASVSLPNGPVTLRVTAIEPNGQQAIAERKIVVAGSGYATVPGQVVRADHPEQAVPNIPVSGATRMYLWSGRGIIRIFPMPRDLPRCVSKH